MKKEKQQERKVPQMKKIILSAATICTICLLLCGCVSETAKDREKKEETAVQENQETDTTENRPEESASQQTIPEDSQEKAAETSQDQSYTVQGYVLEREGDVISVDLENPGARNYPGEGLDRSVNFSIADAEILQEENPVESAGEEDPIRPGITVEITYHVEGTENRADKITTDNDEKEIITYVSSGEIGEILEHTITLTVSQGEHAGETITVDTSEITVPQDLAAGSSATVTYYAKEGIFYAMSVIGQ